jgi:hypothetical protein
MTHARVIRADGEERAGVLRLKKWSGVVLHYLKNSEDTREHLRAEEYGAD